jgi:hypothetical protein
VDTEVICQDKLIMGQPTDTNSDDKKQEIAKVMSSDKKQKTGLYCKVCLDTRGFRGVYDLSVELQFKVNLGEEAYFKNDQLPLRYSEIIGGSCATVDTACPK